MIKAKLTLVGAGPGDPELISIKGVKALQCADVVLYDALTHPALRQYVSPHCICRCVGKRAGKHSFKQDEINELIVFYAKKYGHVVRLKGGDPFVFARGCEELEYAQLFGLETEVVIGISSVNLAGLYNIPLTKRGMNESFWVVTATTSSGSLSNEVALVAQSSATGVFLMGLGKIALIAKLYINNNRGDLPVAVISKGSLEDAVVVTGTINTIVSLVKKEQIKTPAIIIAGEAVDHYSPEQLSKSSQIHQLSYV